MSQLVRNVNGDVQGLVDNFSNLFDYVNMHKSTSKVSVY